LKIIALKPEHLLAVQMQPEQAHGQKYVTFEVAQELITSPGVGWAAEYDGHVIACAGIVHIHDGRGHAWGMFSQAALAHFKTIHRVVREVVQSCPWRRVEITVDCHHLAARRWAERLGFECEGTMRAYTPDGRDCFLYARIRMGV